MSERGTFVTSYLYDWPNLVPVLRQELAKLARGSMFVEIKGADPAHEEKTRAFAAVMHCGYAGEEAHAMGFFIEETLLAALPEKHGQFSITVTPEDERYTTVFSIVNRTLTTRWLKVPPTGVGA